MAQRRESAQDVSIALPPPTDEDDPWVEFKRGLLVAIQIAAMGLVLGVLSLMYMDYKLGVPDKFCVVAPPGAMQ